MKVKLYEYPNGGFIIYKKTKINKATDFEFGVERGSFLDNNTGITHMLEHMLFKSTNKRTLSQVGDDIKNKTPEINGYTSIFNMAVTLYQSNKKIEESFKSISDMMLNAKLDEQEFEAEKKVVLQEIANYSDNYGELAYTNMASILYKDPRATSYPLGDIVKFNHLNIDDVRNYANKYFVRNGFYMAATGSASFRKIKKLFEKYFLNQLKFDETYEKFDPYQFEYNMTSKIKLEYKDINKVYVKLAIPALFSKNILEEQKVGILQKYLNRFKGVLFHELRETKSLVYSCYVSFNTNRTSQIMMFNFETTKDKINDCIKTFGVVLEKLRQEGIPNSELEVLKSNMKLEDDKVIPSPRRKNRGHFLDYLYYGKMVGRKKDYKKSLKLKSEDFTELISSICSPKVVWISIVGNAKKEDVLSTNQILKALNLSEIKK